MNLAIEFNLLIMLWTYVNNPLVCIIELRFLKTFQDMVIDRNILKQIDLVLSFIVRASDREIHVELLETLLAKCVATWENKGFSLLIIKSHHAYFTIQYFLQIISFHLLLSNISF